MAVIILNLTDLTFSFNGIEYEKNFQSLVANDLVSVSNVYDSKIVLQAKTNFADYTVDGIVYASAALLQSALVGVLFSSYQQIFDSRLDNVEANQLTGVLYFNTYADMIAADATGQLNVAYKVIADNPTTKNGDYTSDGATYTQQTFAVNGTVEFGNVDAVQGGDILADSLSYAKRRITTGAVVSVRATDCIDGGFINTVGDVVAFASSHYSDYLKVEQNETYNYKGRLVDAASIAFYDESKTFISVFNPVIETFDTNFPTPAKCRYIRYCALSLVIDSLITYVGVSTYNYDYATLSDFDRTIEGGVFLNTDVSTFTNQSFINATGGVTLGPGSFLDEWFATDYIELPINLLFKVINYTADGASFAVYNSDFTVSRVILSGDVTGEDFINFELIGDEKYIRATVKLNISVLHFEIQLQGSDKSIYDNVNKLVDGKLDTVNNKIDNIDFITKDNFTYFLNNCICCGDSVTQGHIYDYPRTPANGKIVESLSYPAQLAKMTDWANENAALAGISTIGWWDTYFPLYTYTNYEIAIIELGYNGGLTDTLATDVDPFIDYNDYADTNTGSYCKIIEAMKEANPNIFQILMIMSLRTPETTDAIVIRQIAARYSLHVIDLSSPEFINLSDEKYHGFTDSNEVLNMVHFNAIGYLAKAKFIFAALSQIFETNAKELNDLQPDL